MIVEYPLGKCAKPGVNVAVSVLSKNLIIRIYVDYRQLPLCINPVKWYAGVELIAVRSRPITNVAAVTLAKKPRRCMTAKVIRLQPTPFASECAHVIFRVNLWPFRRLFEVPRI